MKERRRVKMKKMAFLSVFLVGLSSFYTEATESQTAVRKVSSDSTKWKTLSQEELEKEFKKKEGEYSYSESIFGYYKMNTSKESYKDSIVHETKDFFFVKGDQKPGGAYEVIRYNSGKLAIYSGEISIIARNKTEKELKNFLNSKGWNYNFHPSNIFILSGYKLKKAFEIIKELENSKKLYQEIKIETVSHLSQPM